MIKLCSGSESRQLELSAEKYGKLVPCMLLGSLRLKLSHNITYANGRSIIEGIRQITLISAVSGLNSGTARGLADHKSR